MRVGQEMQDFDLVNLSQRHSLGLELHDHLLGVVELLVLLVHGLALLVHLVEEEEPGEPGDRQAEQQGAV